MTTTAIKERPILFSAPMVRSILDGSKTQTRRVIKPQPGCLEYGPGGEPWDSTTGDTIMPCPYGKPGDNLWVREAWKAGCEWDDDKPSEIDGTHCDGGDIYYPADGRFLAHGYDGKTRDLGTAASDSVFGKLRSPLFMPRWASRITLEVTDVRVERVQDISEADAVAEGCQEAFPAPGHINLNARCGGPRREFQDLWDSINAKTYPWSSNPWVWAITFRRINHG